MNNRRLRYVGPVAEVGFTGPVTKRVYVARPDEPFEVDAQDADELVRRFPGILQEVREGKRKSARHRPEKADQESET